MLKIRNEFPLDANAIDTVTIAAFLTAPHSSGTEALIVRSLRAAQQLTVSLVAEVKSEVVGHVAVSPVTINDLAVDWFGLGPVSVLPAFQGQGIGKQLIEEALHQLRALGANGCVVLGEPSYYARFGFQSTSHLVFPDVPEQYFQAVVFSGPVPEGEVAYHEAFYAAA